MSRATQVRLPSRATIRTTFQVIVGLAAVTPFLVDALGLKATGVAATVLAVAAAITRVMAMPAVEDFLQQYVPWLAADKPVKSPEAPVDEAPEVPVDEVDPELPVEGVLPEQHRAEY